MDRFGEIERSRENRTDEADAGVEYRLTRVGEVEPLKKVFGRDEKLEVEEAKTEEDDDSNRGEGERDRSTLVLDFLLEAAAILEKNEEKEMVFFLFSPIAGSALWFGKPSFTRAMYI